MSDEDALDLLDPEQAKKLTNTVRTLAEREQLRELQRRVQADEAEFAKDNPDYYDALEHLRAKEKARLQAAGYSESEALEALAQQELQASAHVMEKGSSPARYAYEVAKQHGYEPGRGTTAEAHGETAEADMDRQAAAEGDEFDRIFAEAQREGLGGGE